MKKDESKTKTQLINELVMLRQRNIELEKALSNHKRTQEQLTQCSDAIANRKNMESRLKESEENFRSFMETTDDSIYIVDKDCNYLYVNKKHQARLGISNDIYIGRPYGEYHTSEE